MKLIKVSINKYKSIETEQFFDVNENITVLVGMNESGKTSILESLAKSNYFQNDKKFKFSTTHDYPRREKKKLDKSGDDPYAISCTYTIPESLKEQIALDLGESVFTEDKVTLSSKFSNSRTFSGVKSDFSKFIENKTRKLGIASKTLTDKLRVVKNLSELEAVITSYKDETIVTALQSLKKYFADTWKWQSQPLNEYIARVYLDNKMPKFLYYDEYYALPSRISIENLKKEELKDDELKTAKALFELADINVDEIINADSYEDFKAELEATQATITDELFKYWGTNRNLEIEFSIDKIEKKEERDVANPSNAAEPIKVTDVKVVEHVLDIRVKNRRTGVSLPLKNRSKGFNWFFSFLVWFKKIQEDKNNNYILLLDEPGLNLHASAQANLLQFLSDLSEDYQILYTTHSPFMIDSSELRNVRTVLETETGTIISESIQEKDPNTLFPLQAALGYDIAQNLFVSKNNLLVEGPADLIYLTILSNILEIEKRTGLNDNITIVPVGGLDKVTSFISLLRGSKLNVACLLDTFTDQKGKQRVTDLIQQKIIHQKSIRFFDEFADNGKTTADIEDIFEKEEYLQMFNAAFEKDYPEIKLKDLDDKMDTIIKQINKVIGKERFNHYRPANKLNQLGVDGKYFSTNTLDKFEKMFTEINKLF